MRTDMKRPAYMDWPSRQVALRATVSQVHRFIARRSGVGGVSGVRQGGSAVDPVKCSLARIAIRSTGMPPVEGGGGVPHSGPYP